MTCDGNITLHCITKPGSFMTCDGQFFNYTELCERIEEFVFGTELKNLFLAQN